MSNLNYQEIAIAKATKFLKDLEVFLKVYYPNPEIERVDTNLAGTWPIQGRYWVKFTLGDGDESLGFVVIIDLAEDGTLAANPRAETWNERNYKGS